ncbi:MAG: hypothetical protein ACI845_002970 [Gammaproteobacteria bacterium]|jgi:hypothetical protein
MVIMLGGALPYFLDTLSGKTKPNLVTWFMWMLAPSVSAGAALASGADIWATARIIMGGLVPLAILIAAFMNRHGHWRLTRFDLGCGSLSLLALIVWGAIDSPLIAILLASAGNTIAAVPTFFKAWNYPETETRVTYVTSFISSLIIFPSIPEWNIENAAFQILLLLSTGLLLLAVYREKLGFGRIGQL